jgi:hypothetical protein
MTKIKVIINYPMSTRDEFLVIEAIKAMLNIKFAPDLISVEHTPFNCWLCQSEFTTGLEQPHSHRNKEM